MKHYLNAVLILFSIATLVVIGGCASANIKHDDQAPPPYAGPKFDKPKVIYVGSFDTSTGEWKKNNPQEMHLLAATELKKEFTEHLKNIAPVQDYAGNETSDWLVKGHTLLVDTGNAVEMELYGGGAASMRVRIEVFNLSQSSTIPVYTFDAYATSAASVGDPRWEIGQGYIHKNAWRLSREATSEISGLFK